MADMVVDGVMDIRAKRAKYHFESDPAEKVGSMHIYTYRVKRLSLKTPVSTYKFPRLISICFFYSINKLLAGKIC